jgi:predicted metal-dependent hydrolase
MISPASFKDEVRIWAATIGVEAREIHIRKMKRKWASCSSRGRLTFDPEILGLPRNDRDEKIVHELLHLKYPNHGRMFRVMLNAYLHRAEGEEIRETSIDSG